MTKATLRARVRARAMIALQEGDNPREKLTDALTDLRHYADTVGADFHAALNTSRTHYLHECVAHTQPLIEKVG